MIAVKKKAPRRIALAGVLAGVLCYGPAYADQYTDAAKKWITLNFSRRP